jgi:hypothetical protein
MTQYAIVPVWWPEGWEPTDPLDVPTCLAPAGADLAAAPRMSLEQALAALRGLNRQNIEYPGAKWHVLGETGEASALAALQTVQVAGPAGTVEELRLLAPLSGGSRGDCSHCPAHHLPACQPQISG